MAYRHRADDVVEDGYNIRLLQNQSVTRVKRERMECASVDIAFPAGLIVHTARSWTVEHRFCYRRIWINAGIQSDTAQTRSYFRFTIVMGAKLIRPPIGGPIKRIMQLF